MSESNHAVRRVPTETLHRFLHQQSRAFPNSSGELSELLSAIVVAVKIISSLVATAGFKGLTGYTDQVNVQGESVRKLDEEADRILTEFLGASGHFGLMVSEEQDRVISAGRDAEGAKYVVAFDPLDGSSNIGTNIPVGTIFSILRRQDLGRSSSDQDFLQPGRRLVAAGYAVYGAKTSFVYSSGLGVHGFTLDPTIGEFVLTEAQIKTPERGAVYSANEARIEQWSPAIQAFIQELRERGLKDPKTAYSSRYVGSLVADFDRNLRNGGIFFHPSDHSRKKGKLRLLYECIPLAFIAEQAGGMAVDDSMPILDKLPSDIHERSVFITGSRVEVARYLELQGTVKG